MQGGAGNAIMKSLEGLSGVVAFVIAVFTAPYLNDLTIQWVVNLFADLYGSGFGYLIYQGWILVCGIALFFLSRALLSLGLTLAQIQLVLRVVPS